MYTNFRFETQEGYIANEFRIQSYTQDMRIVTPTEFMQGCLKKMVGMIRSIEPVTKLHLFLKYSCQLNEI